ncbi:unnamed protein product [Symbiodinium sp. CCMP2592]|nr:unnamed protein product [Symbiodinium sp. CCMP2592]
MTFYDAYPDVLDKAKQDANCWAATVHGKELRLLKVFCGFFREEIPMFERFRHPMLWLVEWSVFESFVIIQIICNALVMALPVAYDEASQPRGVENTYFVFETLVSALFTIGCTCQIARGLFFGDAPNRCYLKEPSNWRDVMVVRSLALDDESPPYFPGLRLIPEAITGEEVEAVSGFPQLCRLWISCLAITFALIVVSMAGTDFFGDVYWRPSASAELGTVWEDAEPSAYFELQLKNMPELEAVLHELTRTSAGYQVMPNEKPAKNSAAYIFKTDPDVLEQSRNMPKGLKRLSEQEEAAPSCSRSP